MTPADLCPSSDDMTATIGMTDSPSGSTTTNDLRLRFSGSGRGGQVLRVVEEKFVIGSEVGCTVRLRSPLVAPVHAWGIRGPLGTLVRAISPDTRINGLPVHEAWLQHGDRLSIGPIDFDVEIESSVAEDLSSTGSSMIATDRAGLKALRQHEHRRLRRLVERLREYQRPSLLAMNCTEDAVPFPQSGPSENRDLDLAGKIESDLEQIQRSFVGTTDQITGEVWPMMPSESTPEMDSSPLARLDANQWIDQPTPCQSEGTLDSQLESELNRLREALQGYRETYGIELSVSTPPTEVFETSSELTYGYDQSTDLAIPKAVDRWEPIDRPSESDEIPSNDALSRIRASLASLLEEHPTRESAESPESSFVENHTSQGQSQSDLMSYTSLQLPEDRWQSVSETQPVESFTAADPVTLHSSLQNPSWRSGPSEGGDEEPSIDSYMRQLLARIGGSPSQGEAETPSASQPISVTLPIDPAPSDPAVSPYVSEATILQPPSIPNPELIRSAPRSAPERRDDLASLRQVANDTASFALDASRRRRRLNSTVGWSSAAFLGAIAGGLLISAARSLGPAASMLGLIALGFAAIALLQTLRSNLPRR